MKTKRPRLPHETRRRSCDHEDETTAAPARDASTNDDGVGATRSHDDAIDATTSQFLLRKTDRVHLHHLTFHVARREDRQMMVDNLAIFKIRMVEVHQSVLRFQDVVQEIILTNLVVAACVEINQ